MRKNPSARGTGMEISANVVSAIDSHQVTVRTVSSPAATEGIDRLPRETVAVAEIHNTIRAGAPVERVDD
ncbi:MAG: hypothetical protein R2862_03325 [Thermoanaerobaculia bacterium]